MNGLSGNMTPVRGRSKRVSQQKTAWSHAAMAVRPSRGGINDWACGRAIRFRFVLFVNNCGRDQLWTNESWLVDGLATRLRRFRKSHQLIRDKPALIRMDRLSDI
jgi:hypothetical protein